MKEEVAISVERLSKKFLRNGEPFWALKDVTFQVNKGEMLGIIGANGSGKSTLLKVLSDIIRPTEGSAMLDGSCASVLDIGSGFHPDLTGVENVKMKADLLGDGFRLNDSLLEEIIEFSDLGDFIHEPVKNYSNGMFVRLAFSIFKVLKQDIMLVDEVLSAGDLAFQNKIRESGFLNNCSGILVSHELDAVAEYCDRILTLSNGRVVDIVDSKTALNQYRKKSMVNLESKTLNDSVIELGLDVQGVFLFESVAIKNLPQTGVVYTKSQVDINVCVTNITDQVQSLDLIPFIRPIGQQVYAHADSPTLRQKSDPFLLEPKTKYDISFKYPEYFFNSGFYSLGFVWSVQEELLERMEEMAFFKIEKEEWENGRVWSGFPMINRTRLSWNCSVAPNEEIKQPQDGKNEEMSRIKSGTLNFETIEFDDMVQQNPTALQDLYKSQKDGFLVRNFLSPTEVAAVVDNMSIMETKNVAETSVGYTYPMIFAEFSLRNDELNKEELQVKSEGYFKDNLQYAKEFKDDFGFDLKSKLDSFFERISGGSGIEVPSGMGDVGKYPFGNFRCLRPNGGGMAIHCGNFFQDRFRLFYSHLTESAKVVDQMSYFIVIQEPESGGALEVFDMRWEHGQSKVDNLENEEVILSNGSKYFPDRDSNRKKLSLKPNPGDMILFQGGNIWHRISEIKGSKPRITFGGFIAPNLNETSFYYWS